MRDRHNAQIELENLYSTKHAKKELHKFLSSSEKYAPWLKVGSTTIEKQMSRTYAYGPKNARIHTIAEEWIENDTTGEDILLSIIIACVISGKTTIQAICAQVAGQITSVGIKDAVTTIGELISVCSILPMLTVHNPTRGGYRMLEGNLDIPDELTSLINSTAYMPPSLVPIECNSNSDAGWKTVKQSVYLNGNHHEGKAPLRFLNIIGAIPFSIDKHMLAYQEADMMNIKDLEDNPKELANVIRRRKLTMRSINDMTRRGNKFHFPHRLDARCRSYASGYQLSPQGNDYKKSLLNLANAQLISNDYNF